MALLRELTFASGGLTGADAFDLASGAVALVTQPPLADDSARFQTNGLGEVALGADYAYVSAALYFKVDTYPGALSAFLYLLYNTSIRIGVRMDASGRLRLYRGTSALGTYSDPLTLGSIYRMEVTWQQSTGSNGVQRLSIADANGASVLVAESTTSTDTGVVNVLRIYPNDATLAFVVDNIAIDDTAMPTLEPIVYPPTELEALTILEVHTRAYSDVTELEAVTILETAPQPAVMRQDHALRAVTFIETQTEAALSGEHNLRAVTILETFAQDQYSGPGTGLLTGDPATVDITELVNALRDGDSAPILTSWAGVDGISGILRVLKRSIDDNRQRQTIDEPFFIPLPDPSLPARQQGGSRIRTSPEQRGNVFRQVKNQQRKIDRGSRD